MKMIRQFAIISIICFLGELISRFTGAFIPGSVIGMILLLIFLCSGIIKLESVENIGEFLLEYLPFFFVPAGVGLMTSVNTIKSCWQYIILIVIISVVVVISITSTTIQLFKRG